MVTWPIKSTRNITMAHYITQNIDVLHFTETYLVKTSIDMLQSSLGIQMTQGFPADLTVNRFLTGGTQCCSVWVPALCPITYFLWASDWWRLTDVCHTGNGMTASRSGNDRFKSWYHLHVQTTVPVPFATTAKQSKAGINIVRHHRHCLPSSCSVFDYTKQTRMWASAQRDGCPAEHRWRPVFNAAKFGWCPLLDAMQ